MIESIMKALCQEVHRHGGALLAGTHRNDLLIHDRRELERYAQPGMTIGWVLGTHHSYLQPLGISDEENRRVEFYTRQSDSDHFYVIKVGQGTFSLNEVTRDGYARQGQTRVDYHLKGKPQDCWLMRNQSVIGRILVRSTGTLQAPAYQVTTYASTGIHPKDAAALHWWGGHCAVKTAGTLFIHVEREELVLRTQHQAAA